MGNKMNTVSMAEFEQKLRKAADKIISDIMFEAFTDSIDATYSTISTAASTNMADKELELKKIITHYMVQLGIPAHIKGYNYIRTAIMLCIYDSTYLEQITKSLYPTVAKEHNTTAPRTERAIRHAIECAWNRGDISALEKIFGYTISFDKGKPTNSEFIAMMVDHIKLKHPEFT